MEFSRKRGTERQRGSGKNLYGKNQADKNQVPIRVCKNQVFYVRFKDNHKDDNEVIPITTSEHKQITIDSKQKVLGLE